MELPPGWVLISPGSPTWHKDMEKDKPGFFSTPEGQEAIYEALATNAFNGNVDHVKYLISTFEFDINRQLISPLWYDGVPFVGSPLTMAIINRRQAAAFYLIEAGADVKAVQDKDGYTPIF